MVPSFLEGLRVVEIGDGVAGSVAAAILGELGATVYKVVDGDRKHLDHQPQVAPGLSALVATLDRAKRVASPPDVDQLVAAADIVLIDMVDGPSAAPDAPAVRVFISPFGLTGPDAGRAGGELVAAAAGGLLGTIEPEGGGKPVSPPGFLALRATGTVAALAALHGLDLHRNEGRRPIDVDVSAQEAVVFTSALPECAHVLFNCPGRAGSGRYVAPSGVFPCNDGHVRVAAIENHQWQGMVAAFGAPEWTLGLEDRPARAEHADMINARVAEWTGTRSKAECAELLQGCGVPATAVTKPEELLDAPQLQHRQSIDRVPLGENSMAVVSLPSRFAMHSSVEPRRTGIRGLRVIELTHVLAGPIVGALLGGMGAQVVRVEDRGRLDIYRRTGPFADGVAGEERGAYFAVANHSKASVVAEGEGVARVVGQLLDRSDVLIENVGQARIDRLGVDIDKLSRMGLLSLRVSGFGVDGPMAKYRVYANNVQAYGGLTWMTRDEAGRIARLGSVLADPLSSVVGATVVAAWALGPHRASGGTADLAMVEVVARCIAEFVSAASVGIEIEPPPGNDLFPYAPHGVYPTADDRWVAIAVQDDAEWDSLLESLGRPDELDRPGWRTIRERFAERSLIDDQLKREIAKHPSQEVVTRLVSSGVRAALVLSGAELVIDPHLLERGFFPEVAHPALGSARIVGLPWRFNGRGPIPLEGPPSLGSTTVETVLERFDGD